MKESFKTGFSFGLTSGIITPLGSLVGLNAGTHSKLAIIGGLLTIAIADSFSDSLGIHVSQESLHKKAGSVWEATISTLVGKLLFTATFILPVYFLDLNLAVFVSVVWGLFLISFFSAWFARKREKTILKGMLENLFIAVFVVLATNFAGGWIAQVLR